MGKISIKRNENKAKTGRKITMEKNENKIENKKTNLLIFVQISNYMIIGKVKG